MPEALKLIPLEDQIVRYGEEIEKTGEANTPASEMAPQHPLPQAAPGWRCRHAWHRWHYDRKVTAEVTFFMRWCGRCKTVELESQRRGWIPLREAVEGMGSWERNQFLRK
jgi:hypothetical protein